jgi:transposase
MNVLKPNKRQTIATLLKKNVSHREINRITGIDRKTIAKYAKKLKKTDPESKSPTPDKVATGFDGELDENTPTRPPGNQKIPKHARSACAPHRDWIEKQIDLGRNAVAIYQDLVEQFGFTNKYNSVKRFVRGLKQKDPKRYDRLEFLPGEEAQVDYGQGARTLHPSGKYRRPRLFVMTLKYSRRSFRKVVWKSSQQVWARLHEQAFRYFGGCTQYVVLDNLKEGVIKPDIYEPELNPLFEAVLKHYNVVADPARVRDPDRKGTVENAIQHTQNTALKGREFQSLEEQNEFLMHWELRWASKRIHGRTKRQVEEMFQEEKPYLKTLPLEAFKYFEQKLYSVYDDGTVQIDKSYYSALPAPLYSRVLARIYDHEIEIIDPATMEIIRRHNRSNRPGSFVMQEEDRIYNPSRQTQSLLNRATKIGPETRKFCELSFAREGRTGQRRMQGIVNLARHYEARHIEDGCRMAVQMDLRSYRSVRKLVENKAEKAKNEKDAEDELITQTHRLIRSGADYGSFWRQHASQGETPKGAVKISRENLPQIWRNANWGKVIEVFNLEVGQGRRNNPDEIWIKSPFTNEKTPSLHLNLTSNIFKDFSSGKGGGILNFCQDVLTMRGQSMNCYEVADWMIKNGISTQPAGLHEMKSDEKKKKRDSQNRPVKADLRRWVVYEHPYLKERGISRSTCQYLGCGFLPERPEASPRSPLNGRMVFQVRGIARQSSQLKPVILSHVGRALTLDQEKTDGKYWGYSFFKGLEIYNQDNLLLDKNAQNQIRDHGLVLVEGFFDVAKLVEAGLLNVGALMGAYITEEQIQQLKFIDTQVAISRINLFLDRDETGISGAQRAVSLLENNGFSVRAFDWNQHFEKPDGTVINIPETIKDAGDMSVHQFMWLRGQTKI